MVLVIVTVAVVALAILLPTVLERYAMVPPPTPTGGANVQIDTYAAGTAWSGQFGDDPAVAVAPNGTIAVAWEGFDELAPPAKPSGVPTFETAIFVSFSNDGGQHYSSPRFAGSPGTVSAFRPTLAFAANGTLFLAYANATNSLNEEIIVTAAAPGQNFTAPVVAERGQYLSSPWLIVLPSGAVVLAFEYDTLVEWATSANGGRSFGSPVILLEGLLTGATEWGTNEITLVGLSAGVSIGTTASIWSITFNADGVGTPVVGSPATITVPYPSSAVLPNMSRPGPSITAAGGLLYLVYASGSESRLALQSSTNGTEWAGNWTVWSGHNASVETPVVLAGSSGARLVVAWESTQGGFWRTYAALYDLQNGLLSTPVAVSASNGFPASVRNWHGFQIGLAIASPTQFVVAWGDGRGLNGTYGLAQIYAATLTASF